MMVPYLNSVVFYHKTTMWSCLSGTACSHVFSRTSSCFGACYLSSFLENLAMLSHRFVLQTFFSRHVVRNILLPTRSESQADMMVGTSSRIYDVGPDKVDVLADTSSRKFCHCSIFDHLSMRISYDLFHKLFLLDFRAFEVRPLLDGHVDVFKHWPWYLVHQGEH